MIPRLHKAAGLLAILTIATFWLSTAATELLLGKDAVTTVKVLIPWGFLILVPAMITAGATGMKLAKGRTGGILGAKRKRMPFIAANGLLVLIPAALFLAAKARAGEFDGTFQAVQTVELVVGALNILMMARNIRDGRTMTAGRRLKAA
ncbi:hypothetical protein LV780_21790 (plasmid) [Cereibacter azotoformans]|uniref:hypothetical protein n=1 Tax=Cereibacter azotoformans TaxID=43057 RepID=UPI000E3582E0|nr:hypothetical protein [Cereibacter azotoformans]AXQ96337.1 hypothetical protein D0Z66_21850 [Cereibacter sphaeroides]UIJ33255.1 hypothetical protein LV780_21655 [Cereibacter azotoformans]UIJ33319.1 hypothetical protein LV780_21790 [Cereibacter azotoformans]